LARVADLLKRIEGPGVDVARLEEQQASVVQNGNP
jgi:hypothetical protein